MSGMFFFLSFLYFTLICVAKKYFFFMKNYFFYGITSIVIIVFVLLPQIKIPIFVFFLYIYKINKFCFSISYFFSSISNKRENNLVFWLPGKGFKHELIDLKHFPFFFCYLIFNYPTRHHSEKNHTQTNKEIILNVRQGPNSWFFVDEFFRMT